MPMNIAIDGPVGAGKSSIADQVAQRLHILHLDTGAMYRTVALYMLRNGIDPQDEQTVSARCGEADVRVAYRDGAQRTMLGGEDVSDLIRTGEVSAAASAISKWPTVRRRMVAAQREIAATVQRLFDGVLHLFDVRRLFGAVFFERGHHFAAQPAGFFAVRHTGGPHGLEDRLFDFLRTERGDLARPFYDLP